MKLLGKGCGETKTKTLKNIYVKKLNKHYKRNN